jgi:ABC-2 type transport system ATP-binding protein
MWRRASLLAPIVVLAMLLLAPAGQARDGYITSFDGTKIVYSFFPATGLKAGQRAPTVMEGPGYSSGRASQSDAEVSALLAAGYNVLTWDPRGFGDSGGNVEIDGPDYEARDVSALIDFIAKQPEAQLDKPGDPRLGMIGGSYGGGIQNNAAAIDPRIDVITPQIAWHSLITSLDKNNTAKGGWGSLLFGLGVEGSTVPGITGGISGEPAGFQFGRMQDPRTTTALSHGLATGEFTAADQAFFATRGPGDLINRVKIPTLITQGTDDTLFTLHEAIENYEAQRAAGATVSMIWFCGGLSDPSVAHGICLDSKGPDPNIVLDASLLWLNRYLKGDRNVNTGPGFQWVSDKGVLHSASSYPPAQGTPAGAAGSGTLPLVTGDASGTLIAAGYAANAVNIPLAKVPAGTELLGEPTLTITYSGTATNSDGRVYAQIVHDQTHRPLGNQVTPIPVTLDGAAHTATFTLEGVAADADGSDSYTLQLTDGTTDYFAAREAGLVNFSSVKLSVPTVATGASKVIAPPPPQGCPAATGRLSGSTLGALRLGLTRTQARHAYGTSATHGRRYVDYFCVSPTGIRAGYASSPLLAAVSRAELARMNGRVVLILTSDRHFALDGVRPGTRLRSVPKALRGGSGYHRVGANAWYVASGHASHSVLKVRGGVVQEIGIADPTLTTGRSRTARFLRSFG